MPSLCEGRGTGYEDELSDRSETRRQPRALAQRLHDANVRVLRYEGHTATSWFGRVDTGLAYDHDPFQWIVVESPSSTRGRWASQWDSWASTRIST